MLYSFKQKQVYRDPTEEIDLNVYSSVKSSEERTNRPNSFDVYNSTDSFSLVASTPSNKEEWIRAVGKAIVQSRTKAFQPDTDAYGN